MCQYTHLFTKKYQPLYYAQFRGDLYDLAMDFYTEFLTPKARVGVKQTLLDKFDPSITTLQYLLKVSVQRKLIDRSRRDRHCVVSLDEVLDAIANHEQSGSAFPEALMTTTENDEIIPSKSLLRGFIKLPELQRNQFVCKLFTDSSTLLRYFQPTFRFVDVGLKSFMPVQQVTEKTIVVFH